MKMEIHIFKKNLLTATLSDCNHGTFLIAFLPMVFFKAFDDSINATGFLLTLPLDFSFSYRSSYALQEPSPSRGSPPDNAAQITKPEK